MDLGCLAGSARPGGPAAADAYPADVPGLAEFAELRRIFTVGGRFVMARRFPARLHEADAALAAYLG